MSSRVAVGRNLLKSWLLLGLPTAGAAFLGWRIGDYRLALLFGGSLFLLATVAYWYADRITMGMVGARELLATEAPGLQVAVDRLALRAHVVKPKLYVIQDPFPRALSGGRGAQGGAAFAISTGLLAVATPAELEGIVAHELAHLRHRDVLVQTLAVTLAAAVIDCSRVAGPLARPLLFVLAPLAASFEHLLLSPNREYQADRLAAELCGSPHGLADALLRLEQAAELVSFEASPATEPLYTTNPFAEEGLSVSIRHASSARRTRQPAPGARPRLARKASRSLSSGPRKSRGRTTVQPRLEKNGRRPTLPGDCSPSTIGAERA